MSTFLIIFFTVYGTMNAYILWWTQRAFALRGIKLLTLCLFLLLMVTGFVIVRVFENDGTSLLVRALAYTCYIWMAVALWFLVLGLMADTWNLVIWTVSRLSTQAIRLFIPYHIGFIAIAGLILLASLWGVVEANRQVTEKITIRSSALPPGSAAVTIAQISDVHLGLIEGKGRLEKIFAILDENTPDILVATGDLLDGMAPHLNHLSEVIAEYDLPMGKYAVMGNHEFYAGADDSVQFMNDSGFKVLRGESVNVGDHLTIAGVDDPAGKYTGQGANLDEEVLLPGEVRDRFVLLLKHQPVANPGSLGRFDLQLSGHTHKGQIFPFNFLVGFRYALLAGMYDLGEGSSVYINRGTGTWGPPLRVLSPPEVTIITIVPEAP